MFASLQGKITHLETGSLTLQVGGVGYLVAVPSPLSDSLKMGQELTLHIHTAVSETDIRLFGFAERASLLLFQKLLKVKGVGPKVALAILDLPANVIQTAILGEDYKTLSSVPGLGKKTAEQICLDLRNKLDFEIDSQTISGAAPSANQEVLEALCNLGCDRHEVLRALREAPADLDSEGLIRWYLGRDK